ncbi:hypothetical protein [Mycobacterium palustre]|uniref:hypothetical protein n=1 Tax=Mycobacterium palustre TaxID=153971 RepID=UPI0021F399CA|nr:hypothetical protein [Mycobacterium palustre]MCV7100152.1 hypothetical protein [Mycobacterium palustre]
MAPAWNRAITSNRVVLAALMISIFVGAIVGIVVTLSMGQTTAALVIALVAGGFFSAALC